MANDLTDVETKGAGLGLLLLAVFIHTMDAFIRLPGGRIDWYIWTVFFVLYAVLAIVAEARLHTWKGPIIASLLAAFVIPFIYAYVAQSSIVIGMLMLLMPTWVIYLLIIRGTDYPRLGTLYLIFWIVFLAFSFMPQVQTYAEAQGFDLPTVSPGLVMRYTVSALYRGYQSAYQAVFVTAPEIVAKEVKRTIAVTTGDYYTGSVDQSAEKKLGVYMENLKPAQSVFYEDEPVTVFANLRAETIANPIDIKLSCVAQPGDIKADEIIPKQQFTVETYEEESIDCIFRGLKSKRYTAKLTANFDFATRSYQKVYFMDKDRLRDYQRRRADPLEGFPDKNPTTQYSPGPLMLGMGVGSQPIGIIQGEKGPTIGVTIDNLWAGKLKQINRIIIYTPKGLAVEDINGIKVEEITCELLPQEEQEGCDDSIENVYAMPDEEILKLKDVLVYNFRAHTQINNYDELLGESPVAIRNFKVSVYYDYTYSSTVGFNVEKEREAVTA